MVVVIWIPRSPESLHEFTLDELMSATSRFSEAHFNGDFYEKWNLDKTFCRPGIYKGSFKNRREIVVKCLNKFSDDGEWLLMDRMELECLAMVRHPHLVTLLGFCDYDNHRMMLVYEDMPRESLKHYLSNDMHGSLSISEEQLLWLTRLKIAVGAAKGLAFLHEADKPMVHGDFNASNILLYPDRMPKLFGFCLAKDNLGGKTAESDVYNFGVVLLELLAGRPAIDENRSGLERDLVECSRTYLRFSKDKLIYIMDPSLKGKYSLLAAYSTAKIAHRCLKSVTKEWPSMRDVVEALEPLLKLGDNDKAVDVNWEVSSLYPASWDGQHEFKRSELMSATSNFSGENLLGKADYGHIYKGAVNGKLLVAVMKLHPDYNRHRLKPEGGLVWCVERMNHPHILTLLGYCNQDYHDILVYEYMPRVRLVHDILETNHLGSLPWLARLKIAVGAAKGLAYLEDEERIYHSGFKASCIMVDSDKTTESDVYNFGVVLLELLAGRPSIDEKRRGRERNLVKWSRSYLRANKLHNIMDPRLQGQYSLSAACSTATIVRRCLHDEERPSIRDVVDALEPLLDDDRNNGHRVP